MPSTYTQNNGIEKPATGEQANNWGQTVDNDLDLIDQAADGFATIALATLSYTLQVTNGVLSNGRCKTIVFTGSPSGQVTITISPGTAQKLYYVVNMTTQQLVFSSGGGTSFTLLKGAAAPIYSDGAGNVSSHYSGSSGALQVNRLYFTSLAQSSPGSVSYTLAGGAGTSPSGVSVNGTDSCGAIALTSGSSPAAATSIITVNFASPNTNAVASSLRVFLSPFTPAAASLSGATAVYVNAVNGTGPLSTVAVGFQIISNGTPLTAATAYGWDYLVVQ